MVKINTLNIEPNLINSSCAWASDIKQLSELYNCPYTGAVTTRTATVDGFRENMTHSVAYSTPGISSVNSYGYSPHPLATYLGWIKELLTSSSETQSKKPFIISITASDPGKLRTMVKNIQCLRSQLHDDAATISLIGIELNTSCPNIPNSPPMGYNFTSLSPLLSVLKEEHANDPTLTIGLKLPPFVYRDQFCSAIAGIKDLCLEACPIAFFTCTNTLGNCLLFSEQSIRTPTIASEATALCGLAGEALHPLALGNVYTFFQLLREPENAPLRNIVIIGVGGVTSAQAANRMRRAGALVVGCATLLGMEGIAAFKTITG